MHNGRYGALGLVAVLTMAVLGTAGCSVVKGGGEKSKPATTTTREVELAGDHQPLSLKIPTKPVTTIGTNVGGVDLELYAVQRSEKVTTVVFGLHNTGDKALDMGPIGQNLDENRTFDGTFVASNVAVVDTKGLKEYRSFVDEDDGDVCLCSVAYNQNQPDFEADERRYYATQVPSPPADVTQVNVRTGLGTVTGAKIEG